MNAPLYTVDILRLAATLPEPRALDRVDGSAELRSPTCGSVVRTEVQVDSGRVTALSQHVQACAFGQASASLLAAGAIGKCPVEVAAAVDALAAWLDGTAGTPGDWPGLEALAPARSRKGRHGAILLPFRTLAAALEPAR
ncbi:iron-sulfur cluster assembly scaffold protein [Sphingomonas sinipercae]|uniref:Iron-sulfur cluster assembly scaffold protein n=1 Tax=Sphingomonas sinipercae TaxID=2714944 RepID=A0A6G7ZPJ6_9SPHN|nr:iron-sulfur cluster assembly scaffold protein [Sphingomonas sinipercae]QIL02842.1 iron-sulfur cluster assembly scaffold protein [Sphingomonas sinipercae]